MGRATRLVTDVWDEQVLPRMVELTLSNPVIDGYRQEAATGLRGEVLEIGFGSGLNVRHFPSAVSSVDAVEPSGTGWRLSEPRRARSQVPVRRAGLDGQRLDAADASYDGVLSTFTLCTIPDVATALQEVRRVLRPGAELHFVEHGLSPDPGVARWQRRLEPVQRRVAGGCHLTRDVPALLTSAGLEVVALEQHYLPGPAPTRPWGWLCRGRAVKR